MRKDVYSQTIQMKDTEGAKATWLIRETPTGMLELTEWCGPTVSRAAVFATLCLAMVLIQPTGAQAGKLRELYEEFHQLALDGGAELFPEGEAISKDDLPF